VWPARLGIAVSAHKYAITILSHRTLAVWLFDEYRNLAIEKQRRTIGVLKHMRLFADHQVAGVFQVVEQIFVR
jgi:hypothetical protein